MADEREAFDAIVGITELIQERNYSSMSKFFDDLFATFSSKSKVELVPETIEPTYSGIHLNENYEEGDFLKMVDSFRNGNIIHAKYAMQILTSAIALMEKYPNISYCDLKKVKTRLPGVVVVGDLHGSFKDLCYIIDHYGIPGKNYRFVFNGDFVDRGPQQCEVVLTLLYAFLLYPSRVFLNRGNHEDLSLNLSRHFDPNFKKDTDLKFNKYGPVVFNQAQRLFRRLPLATVVENNGGFKCFVTHGGLSNRLDLEFISSKRMNRFQFASITLRGNEEPEKRKMAEQLTDLLWSDPLTRNGETGCFPNEQRGIGWVFGKDVSENFCRKYGFNTVIRSHEVRDNGVTRDHPHCYTIFSSSNYCYGRNKAAVIVIDADEPGVTYQSFVTDPFYVDDHFNQQKNFLISSFKAYLELEASEILPKFRQADTDSNGWLEIDSWANILSNHISEKNGIEIAPVHFVTLKDYLCPCDDETRTALYNSMFRNPNANQAEGKLFEFLDSVFYLIDLDGNGSISKSEAQKALSSMNSSLGTNYTPDFLYSLDSNQDGYITLDEFKHGFAATFNLNLVTKF